MLLYSLFLGLLLFLCPTDSCHRSWHWPCDFISEREPHRDLFFNCDLGADKENGHCAAPRHPSLLSETICTTQGLCAPHLHPELAGPAQAWKDVLVSLLAQEKTEPSGKMKGILKIILHPSNF